MFAAFRTTRPTRWTVCGYFPLVERLIYSGPMETFYSGKTILVTGACGGIGSAISKALLRLDPRLLILVDHSEFNVQAVRPELTAIPNAAPYELIFGDICDGPLLTEIFRTKRPEIIIHSAAFKHVPLLEANPFEAIRNNVFGTMTLARAAVEHRTNRMMLISTDKAVNPQSILGLSKRLAELISARWSSETTRINATRLANVSGSPGSVVPLFLRQISQGGPVTVTDPEVSRYFLTLKDAVELVLAATTLPGSGEIFIPKLAEPVRVVELARQLIREAGLQPDRDISIVFTGLRPGDKLGEEFILADESVEPSLDPRLNRIHHCRGVPDDFDASMVQLLDSLLRRNLPSLLEAARRLVPEYSPSDTLLGMLDGKT